MSDFELSSNLLTVINELFSICVRIWSWLNEFAFGIIPMIIVISFVIYIVETILGTNSGNSADGDKSIKY